MKFLKHSTRDDVRALLACLLISLAAGFGAAAMSGCGGCQPVEPPKPPVVVPEKPKADQVVYVYEKDDTAPSPETMVLLDKLNRAGIMATDVDDDVVDGTGEVPEQYKAAIDAARLAGLPAFVMLSKGKFLDFAKVADLEKLLENTK